MDFDNELKIIQSNIATRYDGLSRDELIELIKLKDVTYKILYDAYIIQQQSIDTAIFRLDQAGLLERSGC